MQTFQWLPVSSWRVSGSCWVATGLLFLPSVTWGRMLLMSRRKRRNKANSFFWLRLMTVCFLLESCLWLGVARQSKSCLSEGLIECEFVLLWGAGSLVSSAVDLNRWARGSDYITYKRTGLSDIWGSPKSREESWLFSWPHHRWKGLSFYPCPSFFPSVPYVGALWQLARKRGRFHLNRQAGPLDRRW